MQARIMVLMACAAVAAVLLAAHPGAADVFNMGGTRNPDGSWTGLASLETIHVGNPGNPPDVRYNAAGDGSVPYEYDMGKYEVTAGQYCEFLNAVAGVDFYGLYNPDMWSAQRGCRIERYAGSGTPGDPYRYRVASDWANRPVNYVSWGDAARFANWLHNGQPTGPQDLTTTEDGAYFLSGSTGSGALMAVIREPDWKWAIPSEDEWYKAAYHKNDGVTGNYFDYPTGTDSVPSGRLLFPDPGNNATFNDEIYGWTIGPQYFRTEVGAHENSDSPYGTFDQGGNVREWSEMLHGGPTRGVHGGFFGADEQPLRAGYSDPDSPTAQREYNGFRVVQVPEPASMAVLGLGGMAALLRRRRH
jgi:sulfatase modifying factor 1